MADHRTDQADQVAIGTWVKVAGFDPEEDEVLYLVPDVEADPMENKIPASSPLGRALDGKRVGDRFQFNAPKGQLTLTVLELGTE